MIRIPIGAHPSRRKSSPPGLLAAAIVALGSSVALAQGDGAAFRGVIGDTAQQSKPDFPTPRRPRAGSPNVVIVHLDDVGFADLGCYGSEIATPNIDRLAASGLRFNDYHTRAICSPTRAALLTGRNSHAVGVRTVVNIQNGYPNGRGRITPAAATLAEILSGAGYSTFAVGKWHLVPVTDTTAAGPFDHWPTRRGFDRFYGFLDGMTNQYQPDLVQDNTRIPVPNRPGYHLTEDLVDHAIEYVRDQTSVSPEKPFFLYLATGAGHGPHHVPRPYVDKYVPVFEKGWDRTREDRLARQQQLGIVPSGTRLASPNEGIKPWSSLTEDQKRLYVRFQAAYAGFLEHTDEHLGRLFTALEHLGRLEDTILIVTSDNGASQEGTFEGTFNELAYFTRGQEPLADKLHRIDEIGSETSFPNYPLGWAQAGNTPFPRYKQNVNGGGVNDPFIISWPGRIRDRGAVRGQAVDVIDVTPTILDVAGIEAPRSYRGVEQLPLHGASFAVALDRADAPAPRDVQYYELHGQRAIRRGDWKAVSIHRPGADYDSDRWELFDLASDFSESTDLAAKEPARLEELKQLWWREARKFGVLPLDDNRDPAAARGTRRQPGAIAQRDRFTYYPGQGHIPYAAAPDVVGRAFSITADLDRRDAGVQGVILANGDWFGGYALYIKDGKLAFESNGVTGRTIITSTGEVPVGKSTARVDVQPGPLGPLSPLSVTLRLDGHKVGDGTLKSAIPLALAWGGLDIGRDSHVPVSPDYPDKAGFALPAGTLGKVVVDVRREPPATALQD